VVAFVADGGHVVGLVTAADLGRMLRQAMLRQAA